MKTRIIFSSTEKLPLYAHYQNEIEPQPAYVTLCLDTGIVDASVSGEVGNAMARDFWLGTTRRYRIKNLLTADQIMSVLTAARPLLQRVLDGAEIVHDGNNYVGRLNPDAEEAEQQLSRECLGHDIECAVITNLADWLADSDEDCWIPADHDDIDAYIRDFDLDGYIAAEDVGEVLTEMWANRLYGGDPLPPCVAQHLIRDGRCADSAWTDELRSFARGDAPCPAL